MAGSTPVSRCYLLGPAGPGQALLGDRCHPVPMTSSVRSAAAEAGDHPLVEKGARLGYAASGLLHLLLAWVSLQLAWSDGAEGQADQGGALSTLAGNPVGSALLWLTVVGFALLTLWQITEAIGRHDTAARVKAVGRTVVYAFLAWTAFTVVQGTSGSAGEGSMTAELLAHPAGRIAVGAAGLAVIGIGGYHVVKGWTKKFLQDLTEHPGRWTVRAGRVGYIAKGVALVFVGALLVGASVSNTTREQGLDAALRAVLELPLGVLLLTLTALGFAAYGVYSFMRARFGRV